MGVILAKFRKEKSTQQLLEALQEKIDTLETFTVDTQEQKKRIVGNFLAVSIGVYVIAFVVFYFLYFPTTWKERIIYFTPLLLFPIIIILLRYLFTWYFQRKINKNSKKLAALRAEKKKILEQVMDKETYKVAVNLLARFADKPSKASLALSTTTPSKLHQPLLNRSRPAPTLSQKTNQLALTSTPSSQTTSNYLMPNSPRLSSQIGFSTPTTALTSSDVNQQLRRRRLFPIVNQHNKGVFDRIIDVLIGDGPQDRFAMICKECYSHNGMALKEDFEYTTFKCAFCDTLNPARKARPVAPRLSVSPASIADATGSDSSDSDEDKEDSEDERSMNLNANTNQFSTPSHTSNLADKSENENTALTSLSSPSSGTEDEQDPEAIIQSPNSELDEKSKKALEAAANSLHDNLLKHLQKSDSAIEDITISPE